MQGYPKWSCIACTMTTTPPLPTILPSVSGCVPRDRWKNQRLSCLFKSRRSSTSLTLNFFRFIPQRQFPTNTLVALRHHSSQYRLQQHSRSLSQIRRIYCECAGGGQIFRSFSGNVEKQLRSRACWMTFLNIPRFRCIAQLVASHDRNIWLKPAPPRDDR